MDARSALNSASRALSMAEGAPRRWAYDREMPRTSLLSLNVWVRILSLAALLAVVALLSNITTEAQLSGRDQLWFTVRRAVSVFVNAGTLWAGISILAGWMVSAPVAGSGGQPRVTASGRPRRGRGAGTAHQSRWRT